MPRVTVADGSCEVMCGRVALSGQGGGGTANDGLPVVWRISVEAVVQRDAKRVDVGGGGDYIACELLGRRVSWRAKAKELADGLGERASLWGRAETRVDGFCIAEVDKHGRPAIACEDVGGLDVAMDVSQLMEFAKSVRKLKGEIGDGGIRFGRRQGLEQFRDKIGTSLVGACGIEGREIAGMEALKKLCLAFESRGDVGLLGVAGDFQRGLDVALGYSIDF